MCVVCAVKVQRFTDLLDSRAATRMSEFAALFGAVPISPHMVTIFFFFIVCVVVPILVAQDIYPSAITKIRTAINVFGVLQVQSIYTLI